jgi:hypothetical protein
MSARAISVGRLVSQLVIALLALVMLCAGSLRHAVERTPINKETVGFKFSKTLELPHKKAASATVAAVNVEPAALDASTSEYAVPLDRVLLVQDSARRPTASRAPPPV